MTVESGACGGGPAGRTRGGNADWLTGSRITAVHGVFYRPEGPAGEPEAVEFVIAGDQSVLLTCTSDWTLRITPGTWPLLPDWCVPAGQWQHAPLIQLPPVPYEGAWTVVGTLERRDGNGEVHEAVIRCEEGDFVVTAGDTVAVRFHHRH
ncbi:hypothetical protein ABT013_29045 [Streptomyces bacillaris]|uniref:hypothetical protein n=1 Tax=Streptomyces TaxID=1883 RepID=UPI00031FB66B|nr:MULTISPECIES: hypothetical protein [Streptomyces]MYR36438.1 hypothetical protein [Streptomyces sp. SID4944]ALC27796.1 hypothetical protein ABE83_12330 [Streptomyces sp. CFMR 7]MBT3075899.1 hypothetical protein [Streptomyces sp. COG21]MBT3079588.1 hypothetical protein [Streptomyces sp. COG20]MBT3086589.1 hypothetical protein [Streptomyces sp. CYG21]